MAETAASGDTRFYVTPALNPKSRSERYKRVHFYVSQMGVSVSARLKERLLAIRGLSEKIADPDLAALAAKNFNESEFLPAVKELLCIWIHLDAADQGGDMMPAWLMNYMKLALYASDYLIPAPDAMSVMDLHSDCADLDSLCSEVSIKACEYLGFGFASAAFAPGIKPLLTESRAIRQNHLKDSLCKPLEELG
ncbi:MAG: hypothetical protein K2X27_19330 [Candidatus Obscuribacterales bacterium]|nr:hypothetical protein [Candidatus Obscuribacterales bacterium]